MYTSSSWVYGQLHHPGYLPWGSNRCTLFQGLCDRTLGKLTSMSMPIHLTSLTANLHYCKCHVSRAMLFPDMFLQIVTAVKLDITQMAAEQLSCVDAHVAFVIVLIDWGIATNLTRMFFGQKSSAPRRCCISSSVNGPKAPGPSEHTCKNQTVCLY